MGWEVVIARSPLWWDAWHVIDREEVNDLVRRHPDLSFNPDRRETAPPPTERPMVWWRPADHHEVWLRFDGGRLFAKHPDDATLVRMVGLGADLDAWVVDEDAGPIFELTEGGGLGYRTVDREVLAACGALPGVQVQRPDRPFRSEEWLAIAGRPDVILAHEIEAWLPSGVRRIPCPPLPTWTGHPSGRPVPIRFDEDSGLELWSADEAVTAWAGDLAMELGARLTVDG